MKPHSESLDFPEAIRPMGFLKKSGNHLFKCSECPNNVGELEDHSNRKWK